MNTLAFVTLFSLPIVAALVLWLVGRSASTARGVSISVGAVLVAVSGWQVAQAASGEVFVHAFGGWAPPFGIVFVVDRLSAVLVVLADVLYLVAALALRPGCAWRARSDAGRAAAAAAVVQPPWRVHDRRSVQPLRHVRAGAHQLLLVAPGARIISFASCGLPQRGHQPHRLIVLLRRCRRAVRPRRLSEPGRSRDQVARGRRVVPVGCAVDDRGRVSERRRRCCPSYSGSRAPIRLRARPLPPSSPAS